MYSFEWLMMNSIHWSIRLAWLMSTLQSVVFILVVSNDSEEFSVSEVNKLEFVFGNRTSYCACFCGILCPQSPPHTTEVPPLPAPLLLSPSLRSRLDLQVAVVGALELHGERRSLSSGELWTSCH